MLRRRFGDKAEEAKNAKKFEEAKALLLAAAKSYPSSDFIIQRLILMTYKSQWPDALTALLEAKAMLNRLNPENTTDPETLGLGGAICKRIFEVQGSTEDLDQALWYYNRGFYVKQDYYNGINAAFLYNLKATLCDDQLETYANYGQARELRRKVLEICKKLRAERSFKSREDQEWIFLTMAECAIGLGEPEKESAYLELRNEYFSTDFAMSSYQEQKARLTDLIQKFRIRWSI